MELTAGKTARRKTQNLVLSFDLIAKAI